MKKLCTVILICALVFCAGIENTYSQARQKGVAAPVQAAGTFGVVEVDVVLLFHPLMKYFVPDLGIFIKPFKEGTTLEQLASEIQARQQQLSQVKDAISRELNDLNKELVSKEGQIEVLRKQATRRQANLNQEFTQKYVNAGDEERKKQLAEYNLRMQEVDQEFYREKEKIDKELAEIKKKISTLENQIWQINYMNEKDSLEMARKINEDIREAVAFVAQKRGLSGVFNSSFSGRYVESKFVTDPTINRAPVRIDSARQPNYSVILDSAEPLDSEGRLEGFRTRCRERFAELPGIASFFSKGHIVNDLILYGGVDITLDVLLYVLYKHGVAKERSQIIIETVAEVTGKTLPKQ